jgi:hypothetical protein
MRAALLLVVAAFGLAACGESEQVVVYKQGKYQGKPDSRSWDNEPVAAGPKWTKGDKASWETQIKNRQLAQHEHRRIYQ